MSFVTIFGIICFILVLVGVGVAIYFYFNEKEEEPVDNTLVDNDFASSYTNGHSKLICTEIVNGVKRKGLKLLPKDIPNLKYYDSKSRRYKLPKFEPTILWLPEENIEFLGKGTSSSYKNIIKIIPMSVYHIPLQMRNTSSGKMMMNIISGINDEKNTKEFVTNEMSKQQGLIKEGYFGELSPKLIEKQMKMLKDAAKISEKDSKFAGPPINKPYRDTM